LASDDDTERSGTTSMPAAYDGPACWRRWSHTRGELPEDRQRRYENSS